LKEYCIPKEEEEDYAFPCFRFSKTGVTWFINVFQRGSTLSETRRRIINTMPGYGNFGGAGYGGVRYFEFKSFNYFFQRIKFEKRNDRV
jgi:hypothetical protein